MNTKVLGWMFVLLAIASFVGAVLWFIKAEGYGYGVLFLCFGIINVYLAAKNSIKK